MQRAAEAGAASPELCIHVSTLLPFPHMQNPSTAQVSFKSSIPSKPVSSLEVFKGPKNTSRQARRLSLPHQQLHIACFHFPGKEQPWILEAATPAWPANLSSWKTAKSSFFFQKRHISPVLRLFFTMNRGGLFPLPTASRQSRGISVICASFEWAYADKSRYLNQFLHRMSKKNV